MSLRDRMAEARRAHDAQVEDSVVPRVVTTVTVVLALVGVAATGAAGLVEVGLSIALVVLGNLLSHHRRRADNRVLKGIITVAVLLVMVRFFDQLGSSQTVDDARMPLTSMFLAIQTLHAFDLPRTRDLTFTVSASLALVALGAAASRTPLFLGLALVWLLLAGASLWVLRLGADHRRGGQVLVVGDLVGPGGGTASTGRAVTRLAGGLVAPVVGIVLVTAFVFLALPRPEVGSTVTLPFQQLRDGVPSPGGVTNPGLPASQGQGGDFDPVSYFGLAETVDIRTAGELSDQLVLRVRSARPRLLRGMVFDTYADNRWTRQSGPAADGEDADRAEPVPLRGLPVRFPTSPGQRESLTQTVEVVTATPNLVFAAGDPLDLYHAGQSASLWDDDTVTVATTQDPGTVYSVISQVPVASIETLRAARGQPPEDLARWLQAPESLSDRTRALSAELVDPAATNHRNAESVMEWIGDNVAYSLDLDDHDPDADAVDTLLFDRQLGWCEPISASMVMLLRAGGVPARWVTGFQPGDYDVLSGYWEVRAKHAHAWVEVWVPDHGWISFDPTGAVPTADGAADASIRIPLLVLLRQLGGWLAGLSFVAWLLLVLGVAAGVGAALGVVTWRRTRTPLATLPRVTWEPWETPSDLADRLARDHHVARSDLDVLVASHHARSLDRPAPRSEEIRRAHRDTRRTLRIRRRVRHTRPTDPDPTHARRTPQG